MPMLILNKIAFINPGSVVHVDDQNITHQGLGYVRRYFDKENSFIWSVYLA